MPDNSIERFVLAGRKVYPPMSESTYQSHVNAMARDIQSGFAKESTAKKSLIIAEFGNPILRILLSAAWSTFTTIGRFFAMALVSLVLAYLAQRTIEEVAELIVQHSRRNKQPNPP